MRASSWPARLPPGFGPPRRSASKPSPACRARRSSANAARLEACCGDNSARGGVTDGHRPASERRLLTLFDRRVERVHIDVNDPSDLRLVHNGEASRFGTLRERRNRGSVARSLSSGTGGLMARTRERDQIVSRMVTSRSRAVPPAGRGGGRDWRRSCELKENPPGVDDANVQGERPSSRAWLRAAHLAAGRFWSASCSRDRH
jgi:hypothetical protein